MLISGFRWVMVLGLLGAGGVFPAACLFSPVDYSASGTAGGGVGAPCQADFNCNSGACSGGFCCKTACAGPCVRCDSPGHVGECTLLPAMSEGSCPATRACDANGACRKKNGESCAGALECASALCASGACSP